ncbi:hypothetical protein EUGRSUZ_H03313 [Eucalyptus grandis]|uniref:Uncharacterized protein n=2 Tax=Eucalyptus grandis TaxID=71139 RepID=A0ACC3JXR2_EUCGR|nr:hypothetical protein EUGRSUZ_H03313 [Eucalyptus grandis]
MKIKISKKTIGFYHFIKGDHITGGCYKFCKFDHFDHPAYDNVLHSDRSLLCISLHLLLLLLRVLLHLPLQWSLSAGDLHRLLANPERRALRVPPERRPPDRLGRPPSLLARLHRARPEASRAEPRDLCPLPRQHDRRLPGPEGVRELHVAVREGGGRPEAGARAVGGEAVRGGDQGRPRVLAGLRLLQRGELHAGPRRDHEGHAHRAGDVRERRLVRRSADPIASGLEPMFPFPSDPLAHYCMNCFRSRFSRLVFNFTRKRRRQGLLAQLVRASCK